MGEFKDLILKHEGKRICVMGGAPTLQEHLDQVDADVWISVNEHGAKLYDVDYIVAMDEWHQRERKLMRQYLKRFSKSPVISMNGDADYQLETWPGNPRRTLSGMVAAWVAWIMGAKTVIIAGMDAYDAKPSAMEDAKRLVESVYDDRIRIVGGGPLVKYFKEYNPSEKFGRYKAHSAIRGLLGIDERIKVRVLKPTEVRGIPLVKGDERMFMRHEVADLLHHKMLMEI